MTMQKSKSIRDLENRMQDLSPESYRFKVLSSAKDFKSSWIELGQYLFSVYKDKLYKEWEYLTFEAYCSKEVGIRQATAVKLLKSYSFLETEEPAFLKKDSFDDRKPHQIPSFEAVNALRLAKESEKLSDDDYETLREDVLDNVKEESEVKKKIKYILKTGHQAAREESTVDRKDAAVKKLLGQLKTAKMEFETLEFPSKVIRQLEATIEMLENRKP